MTDLPAHPLEQILQFCATAAPNPWYPSVHARDAGVERATLDPFLDQLRLGGLVRLTDWEQGHGQGYALTPDGEQVFNDPSQRERLRRGLVPTLRRPKPIEDGEHTRFPFSDRRRAFEQALTGRSTPVVTWTLFGLNILVFVIGLGMAIVEGVRVEQYLGMTSYSKVMQIHRELGALTGEDVFVKGQWWRLLSCCFVHVGGLLHLASNMYTLYAIGPLLERLWGRWQFLALYLIAGFGGSCGMLLEQSLSGRVNIGGGASGALWGVMASLATWLVLNRSVVPPDLSRQWWGALRNVLFLNVMITFLAPQISKGAHFGGGLIGLIVAIPLDQIRFGPLRAKLLAALGLVAIPVLCVGLTLQYAGAFGGELRDRNAALTEIPLFNQDYVGPIQKGLDKAQDTWTYVDPLLHRDETQRSRGEIENSAKALASAQSKLHEVSTALRQAGPFTSRQVGEASRTGQYAVESWSTLFEAAEKALKAGENWTPADRETLAQIEERARTATKRWDALLSRP